MRRFPCEFFWQLLSNAFQGFFLCYFIKVHPRLIKFDKIDKITCDFTQILKQECLVKRVLNNYIFEQSFKLIYRLPAAAFKLFFDFIYDFFISTFRKSGHRCVPTDQSKHDGFGSRTSSNHLSSGTFAKTLNTSPYSRFEQTLLFHRYKLQKKRTRTENVDESKQKILDGRANIAWLQWTLPA